MNTVSEEELCLTSVLHRVRPMPEAAHTEAILGVLLYKCLQWKEVWNLGTFIHIMQYA